MLIKSSNVGEIAWKFGFYSETYRENSDLYRFASWEATGMNDEWSSEHCGLWQVSPIAHTPAASLVTRRPFDRT
jgi:hypothetical protein